MSYNNLIVKWLRWLFSDNPDQTFDEEILFLRGNIGYHQSRSTYLESSVEILEGTAILVPIITTHFRIGDHYKGKMIKDEFYLRTAIKEHVDAAGPFWATFQEIKSKRILKLVPNLEDFRIESMPFELNISSINPFLHKMDEPNIPGIHIAMVSGYFVLLYDLPPSSFKVRFGGNGMDSFFTESLYTIQIKTKKKNKIDLSGKRFAPDLLKKGKKVVKPVKS